MSGFKYHLKMLGSALIGRRKTSLKKDKLFTENEIKDLRTAFDLLDRDQDGHVTPNELQFMLRNLGIHIKDELVDDLLKEASKTGNGLIDETEFLQWVAKIQALKEESSSSSGTSPPDDDITQDLVAAFRVFDKDSNGFITRDELKTAMEMIGENVTEAQLSDMLALADIDKDGKINYEEFARLLL
ncbi:calcium-binding protein E63-1 isoform X2 [Culicoides brevitarsis]|uniref:calcium-binding protein E63-1 isoform X2 n=1 Tax=Culicoides brevitarsis TaxID=469753 RepID=UPI00307B4056